MASIDAAIGRLERQLKRTKEKQKTKVLKDGRAPTATTRRARCARPPAPCWPPAPRGSARTRRRRPRRPRIVPARGMPGRPVTLDEAADELLANGLEFLAFVNSVDQMNVLYKRKDGNLGHRGPPAAAAPGAGLSATATMQSLSAARLFEEQQGDLELEILTETLVPARDHRRRRAPPGHGPHGLRRELPARAHPGARADRVSYLDQLGERARCEAIDRLFAFTVPRIAIAKGLEPPPYLLERAEAVECPVPRSPQSTTPFIHSLTAYLDAVFSPETTLHGSLVDVYGVGLLLTGKSGIGKSECALDLVERGHRLVADDAVTVTRRHGNVLIGTGNALRHHMEIRGIGIIDVQSIFGIRSIRAEADRGAVRPAPVGAGRRVRPERPRPAEGRGPGRRDPVRAHPHRA